MNSLFGHLALQFGSSPENLATEALHYILTRSSEGRRSFGQFLDTFGERLPEPLHYRTQAGDDTGAIPDLVACDGQGAERAIIEAKFWAGLTPRQPVAYLDRLPPAAGLVLFLAPARREDTLWHELLLRCGRAGRAVTAEERLAPESRLARLSDGRRLGLTSWRAVLDALHAAVVQASDAQVAADLLQLRGLTDRMDSDLFLPFTGEELTSSLGTRVVQLCKIVDRTVERMAREGLADTKDCRSSGGKHGVYSQFFRLGSAGCRLYFSPPGWSKHGQPLGLEVLDGRWKPSAEVNAKLGPLARRFPQRFTASEFGAWLALEILVGVERDAVIDHLIGQIRGVGELLESNGSSQ
jgi:hypothetical protein